MTSHPGEEQVRALRTALAVSPDNAPLRKLLVDTLCGLGRFDEAETELRAQLAKAPGERAVKLALVECYLASGKDSHAAVILDSLKLRGEMNAQADALQARLWLRAGEFDKARASWRSAVESDAAIRDDELAQLFSEGGGEREEHEAEPDDEVEVRERLRESTSEGEAAPRDWQVDVERPRIRFADVGGMDAVKQEISMKIIQPLLHPELFQAYGKKIGGGILMYGPPGCGKTLLARATAGECKASFFAVGIHDVLDMWVGQSEKNLHALFAEARRRKPCVLFFDEVDALGARRSDMHGGHQRQVINQFLSELDGVAESNEGVLVLGATNAPWHIDPAFRRPGRFDRILFVPPPDEPARTAILAVLLAGKPQEKLDAGRLAAKAKDFSGADLTALVDVAIEEKLREALARGAPSPLRDADLAAALKKVKPTTKEWFATARNHALYANQGGLYDDVLRWLGL